MTEPNTKPRWYWKSSFVLLSLLSVGPLALPLLWFNPFFSGRKKLIWTLFTLAITAAAVYWTIDMLQKLRETMKQYQELGIL